MLVTGFFLVWSIVIIGLTAFPFSEKANERVKRGAVEVAQLYARQLVRLNQQAVIDNRYKDLIGELDSRAGQTPGLIQALVLDARSAHVLAPVELLGQSLPNAYAAKAIHEDTEWSFVDEQGIAYVSAPIRVGTSAGNQTVATAFVIFDTARNLFSMSALVDQIVSSLLIAACVSLLFLLLLYRWIEGSVDRLAGAVDVAMKGSDTTVVSPARWPALSQLADQISAALGRSQAGGGGSGGSTSSEWAIAAATNSNEAAAAFDSNLTVIAWNGEIERLLGIRANLAIGGDIGGASRDIAFEAALRDMASQSASAPWNTVNRDLELSGRRYRLGIVYGSNAYLLNIGALGE